MRCPVSSSELNQVTEPSVSSHIYILNLLTYMIPTCRADIHILIYMGIHTHKYINAYIHTYIHTNIHTYIHRPPGLKPCIGHIHPCIDTNNILFSATKPSCLTVTHRSAVCGGTTERPLYGLFCILRVPAGSANPDALLRHFQDIELSFFYPKEATIKRENVKTADLIPFQFPNQP